MDDQFRARLDAAMAEYRAWAMGRGLTSCRLVHYCGSDLFAAWSVPMADVESRVEALACEGFYVDWAQHEACVYLRVWEYGNPEPAWANVLAEAPLAGGDEPPKAGVEA